MVDGPFQMGSEEEGRGRSLDRYVISWVTQWVSLFSGLRVRQLLGCWNVIRETVSGSRADASYLMRL